MKLVHVAMEITVAIGIQMHLEFDITYEAM